MINSGREWDWMDDKQDNLKGWGFDMERLKTTERGGGGASLSPPKVPRAFSTKVSNEIPGFEGTMEQLNDLSIYKKDDKTTNQEDVSAEEWCYYAGMPSPNAYVVKTDNS